MVSAGGETLDVREERSGDFDNHSSTDTTSIYRNKLMCTDHVCICLVSCDDLRHHMIWVT